MKKQSFKILTLILAVCMILGMSITASAAEITTSGGSGTVSLQLSSVDEDGNPAATKMSVTIPSTLPITVSPDGKVTTAKNCKIVNNSYGPVRVKSITINATNGWGLMPYGYPPLSSSEKVDSNKIGFFMMIGGGAMLITRDTDDTQVLLNGTSNGCYMSGVGDLEHNSILLEYAAIVTPLSSAVKDISIANLMIVVEWDTLIVT